MATTAQIADSVVAAGLRGVNAIDAISLGVIQAAAGGAATGAIPQLLSRIALMRGTSTVAYNEALKRALRGAALGVGGEAVAGNEAAQGAILGAGGQAVASSQETMAAAWTTVADPRTWQRVAYVVIGAGLVLVAVSMLAPTGKILSTIASVTPAGRVAKGVAG